MSFKYGMKFKGQEESTANSVVFATHDEADSAARELMSRWFSPIGWEVIETTDAVNYTFDWDNGLERLVL